MILDDLFESGMSRVLDTMREIKTLSDDEFIQAHDMSKHMWVRTNWPVIKSVASDDSEIKKHLQKPVGDEHLRHGSAVPPVTEGIMDVIKQTFNDNVAGWPMGTSDEQFIQGWARDIKAQTGKTIPTAKLVQLYNHYTKRSPELMQTHGTTNEQGVAEMDTYPHPKSKEGKRLTKAIRDPNAPEVKPQPVKKTVKDATKILNKEFQKSVKEGSQQFGKLEPYWVCINGKKWKRFETYAHARAVHDRLEKKLRGEGSDKKVSLLADDDVKEGLRNPKDNPCWKGYKPVGTKQKGGRTVPNCVPKE